MCGDCVCRPPSGRSIPGGLDHGSRISFSRLLLRAHARGGFSVHVSSLSPVCRNCRNCRTILSDCRTLSDTVGRWKTVEDSKHPVTTENWGSEQFSIQFGAVFYPVVIHVSRCISSVSPSKPAPRLYHTILRCIST